MKRYGGKNAGFAAVVEFVCQAIPASNLTEDEDRPPLTASDGKQPEHPTDGIPPGPESPPGDAGPTTPKA